MNSKETKSLARKKILEGKSLHQVFDELSGKTEMSHVKLAKLIGNIPTLEWRKKHLLPQILLLLLLVAMTAIYIPRCIEAVQELGWPGTVSFVFPAVFLVLAVAIFNYRGAFYKLAAMMAAINIIIVMRDVSGQESFVNYDFLQMAVALPIIILGLYLHSKITGQVVVLTEKTRTTVGSKRTGAAVPR